MRKFYYGEQILFRRPFQTNWLKGTIGEYQGEGWYKVFPNGGWLIGELVQINRIKKKVLKKYSDGLENWI